MVPTPWERFLNVMEAVTVRQALDGTTFSDYKRTILYYMMKGFGCLARWLGWAALITEQAYWNVVGY